MILTIIILSIFCLLFLVCLVWSLKKNIELSEKIENIVEQVENSLDVLDNCYQRATEKSKLEVFSDEPVVRELIDDIQTTRDAILLIANLIVDPLKNSD